MPITTHVTSLELSTKLEALGVPQQSHFCWKVDQMKEVPPEVVYCLNGMLPLNGYNWRYNSAYLASELGEMLPEIPHYRLRIEKTGSSWDIEYRASCYDAPMGELVFACLEPSEADARAKMLIYLIENHLISVEELGK